MENSVLEEIAEFARNLLQTTYGSCGSVDGKDSVIITSHDQEGNDITIKIKSTKVG